jgi:hypothetical protein
MRKRGDVPRPNRSAKLQNFMEMGDAGFAGDQEASPNQGTDVPKHYSRLIRACICAAYRTLPENCTTCPLESSALQSGDIAMLGWRGAGITKYAGLRGVTQRREPHAVAVLGRNWLS